MKNKKVITAVDINVTFKQEGYGRQGLYINGYYLMSVFPNFDEHFDAIYHDDAFVRTNEDEQYINEDGEVIEEPEFIDHNGRAVRTYYSREQFMIDNYKDEIIDLLLDHEEEE